MDCFKYARLFFGRILRGIANKTSTLFSYIFLIISLGACLFILVPQCFDKVPILSYFISEHELPITYELCGKVIVYDENGEIANNNVEVFIGGYSAVLSTTEVNLKFSSPKTNEVYVVIRYTYEDRVREFTDRLIIEDGVHVLSEEFIIYA